MIHKNRPSAGHDSSFERAIGQSQLLEYRRDSLPVGAVLHGNPQHSDQGSLSFVFACDGIQSDSSDLNLRHIAGKLENLLKQLPKDQLLTVHYSVRADDSARQTELTELFNAAPTDQLKLHAMSAKTKAQELTDQGFRKDIRIYIQVTFKLSNQGVAKLSGVDKLVNRLDFTISNLFPNQNTPDQGVLCSRLQQIFEGEYQHSNLLLSGLYIPICPLSANDIHKFVCRQMYLPDSTIEPNLWVMDEKGIHEEGNAQYSFETHLQYHGTPTPNPAWVKTGGQYLGAIRLLEKPAGWTNVRDQLNYLSQLVHREGITNTDIITQFSPSDKSLEQQLSQINLKQSKGTALRAEESNTTDVVADHKSDEAEEALSRLYEGNVPLHVDVTVIVAQDSLTKLDDTCNRMEQSLPLPAWLARDYDTCWITWLATLVPSDRVMGQYGPFDNRLKFFSSEAPGLTPLKTCKSIDSSGIEFIAHPEGTPQYVDIYTKIQHVLLLAATRNGKSVLGIDIIVGALSRDIPVTLVDYPRQDGTTTSTDLCGCLGGAYIDPSKESINPMEEPNVSDLPRERAQQTLKIYRSLLLNLLVCLVLGPNPDNSTPVSKDTVKPILSLALKAFYQDATIQKRFKDAKAAGRNTRAWARTPVLADLLDFLNTDCIDDAESEAGQVAMAYIKMRLRYWINEETIGQAISRPSTVDTDNPLVVFALTNVEDNQHASILSMLALGAAQRRALSSIRSILFLDEAPILFRFTAISTAIGRLCANGAKAGIRVILAAQDPDTIARCPAGPQILQNVSTRLVGRIQSSAIQSFERYLAYDPTLIARNADESFAPNKQLLCSHWLLDDNGRKSFVRYYPALTLLGITANNPDEQASRTAVLQQFPDAPLKGLAVFSNLLATSMRTGRPIADVVAEWAAQTPTA